MKNLEVIDIEKMAKEICEIYQKAVNEFYTYNDAEKSVLECIDVDEESYYRAKIINNEFYEYLYGKDGCVNSWHIEGNFCNIRYDYETDNGKDFYDILRILKDAPGSEEAKEFRRYAVKWYFRAFGTFGLSYNFSNYLAEYVEALSKDYEVI